MLLFDFAFWVRTIYVARKNTFVVICGPPFVHEIVQLGPHFVGGKNAKQQAMTTTFVQHFVAIHKLMSGSAAISNENDIILKLVQ
jgi:hypothetical protein